MRCRRQSFPGARPTTTPPAHAAALKRVPCESQNPSSLRRPALIDTETQAPAGQPVESLPTARPVLVNYCLVPVRLGSSYCAAPPGPRPLASAISSCGPAR
jgi:hypothetical protein